jgi:hypothetical protein
MSEQSNLPFESAEAKSPVTDVVANKKLKLLGKGGVLLAAGAVSNVTWATAIGLNRYLESSGGSAVLPALGVAGATTAIEYGLTHLATAGDLDVEWNPKRRFTHGVKKAMSRFPLAVTSWRGAASGVVLDQITGREITGRRRLAHAATYGTFVGAWVTEPGNIAFEKGWDAVQEVADRPILAACIGATALVGGMFAMKRVDVPELLPPQQATE